MGVRGFFVITTKDQMSRREISFIHNKNKEGMQQLRHTWINMFTG